MAPPRRSGARKRKASKQSGHAQPKKRKAGSRVKGKNVFKGEGKALNADENDEARATLGTGFRKQAGRWEITPTS
jgi:DNA-dependent metalloprotease WSS1